MNIHHLELFYYVTKNSGITAASRNMPYGIQQAAISGQVGQLEESLGTVLFHRRPFELTPAGQKLYDFIKPFFDNLDATAEEIRGGESQQLRVAASEIVMQHYLPQMVQETRKKFPKLKLALREGYHPEVLKWLEQREIDVSLGLLGGKPSPGVEMLALFDLPLVLLVPKESPIRSAEELWKKDYIEEKLITIPTNQVICRAFQEGLAKRKVDWFSGIEVSSVMLVETYVINGYGIGVNVGIPNHPYHPQVRVVPLEDFPKVTFGALYQAIRPAVVDHFLQIVKGAASAMVGAKPSAQKSTSRGPSVAANAPAVSVARAQPGHR